MTALREHLDDLAAYFESLEAAREPELRLLMGIGNGYGYDYRFVRESNGYPGRCAEDCWHSSPEAAQACFEGRTE